MDNIQNKVLCKIFGPTKDGDSWTIKHSWEVKLRNLFEVRETTRKTEEALERGNKKDIAKMAIKEDTARDRTTQCVGEVKYHLGTSGHGSK